MAEETDTAPASGGRRHGRARGPGALVAGIALTVATGAMDAISFLALGGVFTSVMTANLSLLGLSTGAHDPDLARDAAVAIAGYTAGALVSGRIVRGNRPAWRARCALGVELLALGGLWAVWTTAGGHPTGGRQLGLLAVAALAMGGQSGLVRAIGPPGMSTTYLTGILTGLLVDLALTGRVRWINAALLAALVAGAAGGGLLIAHAARAAPALPTGLVALVLLASLTSLARDDHGRLWPHTASDTP
ncbi:YoaK family protein [Streptomyces sp. NPDC005336]|uniref:YoaK family protein n=1 Tax=unclassified Streptomyces TaxID=2593676 RepID=UPI00339F48DA